MKNIKSLLVLPFFFYATEGYLKAFKVANVTGPIKLFVISNFLLCLGLILADFQFFGNTDTDGLYTQAVLVEVLYLAGGAGLNLFSELETR
jgi:Ni,Fe-hydrogenase I cytochrome b subunit